MPLGQIQIRQRTRHKQAGGILRQSPVTHLYKSRNAFDHAKGVFHLRPSLGSGVVLRQDGLISTSPLPGNAGS